MLSALYAYARLLPGLIILGLLAVLAVVAHQRDNWKHQAEGLSAKLESISTEKKVQQHTTGENIKVVTRTIHDADGRAKAIEQAPPAPNCKTKPEVMNADI